MISNIICSFKISIEECTQKDFMRVLLVMFKLKLKLKKLDSLALKYI